MEQELRGKGKIKNFKDLDAWKVAHKLVLEVYRATRGFPQEELYGLVSQMRRAAVSIVSNIAEGFSRTFSKEKQQFYAIALGSIVELQSQLEIAKDLGYLNDVDYHRLMNLSVDAHKLVNGLIKGVRSRYL